MVYVILILLLIILFFVGIMIRDVNRFVVVSYNLSTPKISKPYRMVVLSDLHNKQFGKENEKLLQKIEEQKPQAIMIAGDMITANSNADMTATLHFIKKLSERYPIYYGVGNHEFRFKLYPDTYGTQFEKLTGALKECHSELMENEKKDIPDTNIVVYGLEMDRSYYKRFKKKTMETDYLEEQLGKCKQESFSILLAHNPDYFEEYARWGADLVLSGHVHGGLMKLPILGGVVSPAIRLFPKYDGGKFQSGNSQMILSRGLGTHTLPIRIFNPGELIVIDLIPTHFNA